LAYFQLMVLAGRVFLTPEVAALDGRHAPHAHVASGSCCGKLVETHVSTVNSDRFAPPFGIAGE